MARQVSDFIEITDNREELAAISKIAKDFIWKEYQIEVQVEEAIPTISYWFFRAAIKYLNENKSKAKDTKINILDFMDLGISYREDGDGEKDGNYTPFANPGLEFNRVILSDAQYKIAVAKEKKKRELANESTKTNKK